MAMYAMRRSDANVLTLRRYLHEVVVGRERLDGPGTTMPMKPVVDYARDMDSMPECDRVPWLVNLIEEVRANERERILATEPTIIALHHIDGRIEKRFATDSEMAVLHKRRLEMEHLEQYNKRVRAENRESLHKAGLGTFMILLMVAFVGWLAWSNSR